MAIHPCYNLFLRFSAELNPRNPKEFLTLAPPKQTAFIHPTSSLFRSNPSCVIYNELIKTNKCYMRDVCVVDPDWLAEFTTNTSRSNSSTSNTSFSSGWAFWARKTLLSIFFYVTSLIVCHTWTAAAHSLFSLLYNFFLSFICFTRVPRCTARMVNSCSLLRIPFSGLFIVFHLLILPVWWYFRLRRSIIQYGGCCVSIVHSHVCYWMTS